MNVEDLHLNLGLDTMRALQSERLMALCKRLYHKSAFYKQLFDKHEVDLSTIRGIEDIHKLPFTKKNDLRDHYPFGLFTLPLNEMQRIHCSSGSTGKPTVVGYSTRDLSIFSEVVARSLYVAGARKGMFIQNAYGYGLFTGGLGVHYGAERLGLTVLPISGGNTEKQVSCIRDFKPTILTCTPSYAQTLANNFRSKRIPAEEISLKYVVLGAEPWTDAIRKDVERGLGVKATNIYGLSEVIGPGVSCEDVDEQRGSYIWEDHFYPEVVDPDTGTPLPYGQQGVLVFTTLTKEAMPLIRYWTNDITSIYYDKQGNRNFIKMGPIVGRADDMLIIRGANVYPTQIEACFNGIPGIVPNYRLIAGRKELMDTLEVKVEVSDDFLRENGLQEKQASLSPNGAEEHEKLKELRQRVAGTIKSVVGIRCDVSLEKQNTLGQSEGGKINKVIDKRIHQKNNSLMR